MNTKNILYVLDTNLILSKKKLDVQILEEREDLICHNILRIINKNNLAITKTVELEVTRQINEIEIKLKNNKLDKEIKKIATTKINNTKNIIKKLKVLEMPSNHYEKIWRKNVLENSKPNDAKDFFISNEFIYQSNKNELYDELFFITFNRSDFQSIHEYILIPDVAINKYQKKNKSLKSIIIDEFWNLFDQRDNGESLREHIFNKLYYEDKIAQKSELVCANYVIDELDEKGNFSSKLSHNNKNTTYRMFIEITINTWYLIDDYIKNKQPRQIIQPIEIIFTRYVNGNQMDWNIDNIDFDYDITLI